MIRNFDLTKKNVILLLIFAIAMLMAFVNIVGMKGPVKGQYYTEVKEEASHVVPPFQSGTAKQALYTQMVRDYEGRRIQFDTACQAIPNNVTYKNGTKVMFDNRSPEARTIKIGPTSYNLSGYGYKIITLSSSQLPKTLYVNCGSGVNVAQIFLQK